MRIGTGELQGLLDRLVAAGAPGAAGWVRDEDGSRHAASGLADLRARRPMRPWLHFRAGSATKALVATVVLQLVAESRLSLDDTVERWLPGIVPYGDQVSLRQLLNHTGGVPDYTATVYPTLYASRQGRRRDWTPRELVGLVADQPPSFPPGTSWSYANTGYILLGLVVESATGNGLGPELARRILEPLGLGGTSFPVNRTGIPGPGSRGYSLPLGPQGGTPEGPLLDFTAQNPSWAWAAGALISDLQDLTGFSRALLGGQLLPSRLLAEMLTAVAVPPGSIPLPLYDGYGLGLVMVETPAGRLVGHPGGIPGFLNITLSTLDGRRQLGVMVNVGDRAPDPVYAALLQGNLALGERLLASL
jgi:D-alanyl-D-alanine carboxypeptidase